VTYRGPYAWHLGVPLWLGVPVGSGVCAGGLGIPWSFALAEVRLGPIRSVFWGAHRKWGCVELGGHQEVWGDLIWNSHKVDFAFPMGFGIAHKANVGHMMLRVS